MRPVATVVAFGKTPALDAGALDLEVLPGDFPAIKQARAGSLLFLLCDRVDDPSLAAAVKALRILRKRGGGEGALVVPFTPEAAHIAQKTQACVVQSASSEDAVRCFVEPLAVFGLAGVDPREIHALLQPARVAAVSERVLPGAREALVSCRLRPDSSLRELDDAAREVPPGVSTLVLAGPEVDDDGPRVLAASFY